MNKIYSLEDAVSLVGDGDLIAGTGIVMSGVAEEVFKALEAKFLSTGHPAELTGMFGSGQGNWEDGAWEHLAHEGMLKRVIGGHYATCAKIGRMINANQVEAYNLPQGMFMRMYRNAAKNVTGELTKLGIRTFVDPRLEGGKLNPVTTEDIVHLVEFKGEEWLYYDTPKINIALIRGTMADPNGNISLEEEILPLDMLAVAMAAKAGGGKVIVQVKYIAEAGSMAASRVDIPGIFVDAVVVSREPELNHRQTQQYYYQPSMSGHVNVPLDSIPLLPLNEKKVLCRRAAMELTSNAVVNLGIGTPEGVANVANEEGIGNQMILTSESGVVAGVPCGGKAFGAVQNAWGFLDMPNQFDFYDGGGLDISILGLAQVNSKGDVNVSKFGPKVAGCGGFINITQNTKKLVYCGTFTAGGLKLEIGGGKLTILQEGRAKKFINKVEQVTYSGEFGAESKQEVLYVTERAVFELTAEGLLLTEIAPGVDLQKDILDQMEFAPIVAKDVRTMVERLFRDEPIGLKALLGV
ncbi:propionate CoA-transferase [Spirochaetia bacterium]|nr:propionate CoA-transferase [Spirochaetia bacterium]